jgi:hypothetical protein
MAGKTVAKAEKAVVKKAVVKKADAKKKVDVKKADVKKPVAVVKKADGVKKPVAKKPNVGTKFNLHKLIMLIIRDAPKAKKGNKMTGGVKSDDVENMRKIIIKFVGKYRKRISTQLNKVDTSRGIEDNMNDAEISSEEKNKWNGSINDLILHIYTNIIEQNADNTKYTDKTKLQEYLIDNNVSYPKKNVHTNDIDKKVFDKIFMIVVVALCKVYGIINITQN